MDVSADALPFMAWTEGTLAGLPARIFRISFSGELSYEVAVPASHGQQLWDRLLEAGAPLSAMPYGTEALHVMRAEKGFIMIGDETDGTVTPHDLGLSWAVSKKKDDFIGKRGLERADLTRPDRLRLVGLETLDPNVVLPDGIHAGDGKLPAYGPLPPRQRTIGHVTSTYRSPTLGRSIAMATIAGGHGRHGETLYVPMEDRTLEVTVVPPVFLDPKGERLHA